MNKRTRKARMAKKRVRVTKEFAETLKKAAEENSAAAEFSQHMKGAHPFEKMFVSVIAKVTGQPGADLLMAEAVQSLVAEQSKPRPSWKNVFNTNHKWWGTIEVAAKKCAEVGYPFFVWNELVYPVRVKNLNDHVCRMSDLK